MEDRQQRLEGAPESGRGGRPVPPVLAWGTAAILLASAAGSLAFQLALPHRVPDDDDWARVGARLSSERRPGDAVLVLPAWAEGLRLHLPEALPLHAVPPDHPELARVERLWVAALPRAPRAEVDAGLRTLEARFGPPQDLGRDGPVRLLRYEPRPPRAAWRFSDHVAEARVRVAERECPWRPLHRAGARFQCSGGAWNYVARQTRELDYWPRTCVWAHPVDGAPLTLTFPEVPAGEALALGAGLVGEAALEPRAEVRLGVAVAGRTAGEVVIAPRPGWQTFRVETPGRTEAGPVTLTLTTPDATRRPVCLDGAVVERAP